MHGFAPELFAPLRLSDFATVVFAILQNLNLQDCAIGRNRHGVIDKFVFADDLVDHQHAIGFRHPDFDLGLFEFLRGFALDGFHLIRSQF